MSTSSAATVKCLVWDLDDTVWDGVLLEGDRPDPRPEVVGTIRTLDERGILHAVASRGDYDLAEAHLREVGLLDKFVHLEIDWGAKSSALRRAAEQLGLGVDTLAFIDNDPAERDEVKESLPQVRCYAHTDAADLAGLPEFQPRYITEESRQRRSMYQAERRRWTAGQQSGQHPADFLAGLGLVMTIRPATEADLVRAHELTVRTNQLNSTGRTYSMDVLRELCGSPRHEVLVAKLADNYGSYGTIGLSVSETVGEEEVVRLLLMSCRVMSRGVGGVLLSQVVLRARGAGRRPCAEFVPTEVNRVMLVTLRFAGFAPEGERDGATLFVHSGDEDSALAPGHVRVVFEENTGDNPVAVTAGKEDFR
ncbi:MAG: HAD-IIIC family phosphatase [Pseudonocardiaceae bacterium]